MSLDRLRSLGLLDFTDREVSVEIVSEPLLCESVDTKDVEASAISDKGSITVDFIAGKVSVANEALAGLVDSEGLWELLPSEVNREGVSSIVGKMTLADFYGVVSQEVVPDVRKSIFCSDKES